ncbi:MAG TPA: proton-conducting transporter membrane subunit, partial [Bacteroidales bacterium]|nr:proton-conducting transporter membrane subunit [Bacteroidales bacterium]
MILLLLILIPIAGGVLAWISGRKSTMPPRIISLIVLLIDIALLTVLFFRYTEADKNGWFLEYHQSWIPLFGISMHLALDGLSLLLIALTLFLGLLSVLISWKEITTRSGFFHFNILWILAGIMGVFVAMDLFLFYFFWELMLVPMYFLIGIWGHEHRIYASNKFFLYTQTGGLLMLLAILALYFIHGRNTGIFTFDYQALLDTPMPPMVSRILMYGFLAAFLVKLPVV